MGVKLISARHDEDGNLHGGSAGNQTGHEIDRQNYYVHKKGWVVIRIKDPKKRAKVSEGAKKAYANKSIGYDQYQRLTLYNNVKPYGFDPSKTTKKVETDCSGLVRVCCAYAGIMVSDFYTGNEVSVFKATGEVEILTSDKYCKSSDYLLDGDILVTKTKGHTVIVVGNGAKVPATTIPNTAFVGYIGKITASSLNIRKSASTDAKVVGTFKEGEYVWITKEENGKWGYANNKGWVSLKYVQNLGKNLAGKVTADKLNVRRAAGTSSDVISVLDKGTKVTINSMNADGTWGKDVISGGWVSLKYIKF